MTSSQKVKPWQGEHPNSLWSRADKATRELIVRNRKRYLEHHAEIKAWARNGFLGSVMHSRSDYRWQDDL